MLTLSLCCVYSTISNYWEHLNCVYAVWRVTSCKSKSCPKGWEEFHSKLNERFSHVNFLCIPSLIPCCRALQSSPSEALWGTTAQCPPDGERCKGSNRRVLVPRYSQSQLCLGDDAKEHTFQYKTYLGCRWKGLQRSKGTHPGETLFRAQLLQATLEAASFVSLCSIFTVTSVWLSGQANPYRTTESFRLEVTTWDHLVQPPAQVGPASAGCTGPCSVGFCISVSTNGDYTTSPGKLCQCLTILTVNKYFLVFSLNFTFLICACCLLSSHWALLRRVWFFLLCYTP